MSKSLWNGYTLDQLKEQDISPIDLRMFFFTAHYRSYQDFTWDGLRAVKTARTRLRKKIAEAIQANNFDLKQKNISFSELKKISNSSSLLDIEKSFLDDINLPKVLATINTISNQAMDTSDLHLLYRLEKNILKIDLFVPVEEKTIDVPQQVTDLANQRLAAKVEKDYALADELRNKISDFWFIVKDVKDGFEIEGK